MLLQSQQIQRALNETQHGLATSTGKQIVKLEQTCIVVNLLEKWSAFFQCCQPGAGIDRAHVMPVGGLRLLPQQSPSPLSIEDAVD